MVELLAPSHFRCPISLELMNDPVTLSAGRNIENWFQTGHHTRPSNMQVLSRRDVSPNHTLQRLIRRWCASTNHRYTGLLKLPDVPAAVTKADPRLEVKQILQRVAQGTDCYNNLKKLRSLAKGSDDHEYRKVLREAGAIPILASFAFSPENLGKDLRSCEEALGILTLLPLQNIRQAIYIGNKQLTAISWLLNRGSLNARVDAAMVLGTLAHNSNEMKSSVGATAGVFEGLVQFLKEDLYPSARDTGLKVVTTIIAGIERNTVRAVEAGMVFAVAELLPEAERRSQERPLTRLLELLCACEEGRQAVSAHALVVPMLARIITRRDSVASESAVACLWTVCQCSPRKCLGEAAGQAGIFTQLSHLSNDSRISPETRQRTTELLRQLRDRMKYCDN